MRGAGIGSFCDNEPMKPRNPHLFPGLPWQVLAWCLLLCLAGGALAAWQYRSLAGGLERESEALHRLASQRAGQHDAHLTALSAIATASGGGHPDLFLDVAASIAQFSPRIDDIQLVPLDARLAPAGIGPLLPALAQRVRAEAGGANRQVLVLPHPDRADHYVMLKWGPNLADRRFALLLQIDARQLIGEASPFWSRPGVVLRLSLPDGQPLVGGAALSGDALRYSRVLASASQPLVLEAGMEIGWSDLLPAMPTALLLLLVSAAYVAALAAWRQRRSARAAVEQARLSALESRLAHASRVNALGEMASGLAHELTQPLTAILAQAQASRRMLAQEGAQALAPVLEDTVGQAKRASAILERFRNWSRPQPECDSVFDLRDALANVRALLTPQAAACHARLEFDMPAGAVRIKADPVEMEQVVFNLVRNALEAVAPRGQGRVAVTLRRAGSDVILDVADDGPGIAPALRDRLFTPFTTNRPGGTGLGLALSQRLIERAGGDIFLLDEGPGATFRIVLKSQDPPMEPTP